jgi:hypothetical protein
MVKADNRSISDLLREAGVYHVRDAWSVATGAHAMFSPDGRYLGHMTAAEAVAFLQTGDQREIK